MLELLKIGPDSALPAIITGSAGALARWFAEIMNGNRAFTWFHLPMLLVIGAFLGYMGNELATVLGFQKVASLFAGATGAMGTYGFEFYIRAVSKIAGQSYPDKDKPGDDK